MCLSPYGKIPIFPHYVGIRQGTGLGASMSEIAIQEQKNGMEQDDDQD